MGKIDNPYRFVSDAILLMDYLTNDYSQETEKNIIVLLNAAESVNDMSKHQLADARKKFAECYAALGITQNALDEYKHALELDPAISVKRKIKYLEAIPQNERVSSLDSNITEEIHFYDNLIENRNKELKNLHSTRNEDPALQRLEKLIREELDPAASAETNIYDPAFENMLRERLSQLDDLSKSEFYRIRSSRKGNDLMSTQELDLLTLESMERSYKGNR